MHICGGVGVGDEHGPLFVDGWMDGGKQERKEGRISRVEEDFTEGNVGNIGYARTDSLQFCFETTIALLLSSFAVLSSTGAHSLAPSRTSRYVTTPRCLSCPRMSK